MNHIRAAVDRSRGPEGETAGEIGAHVPDAREAHRWLEGHLDPVLGLVEESVAGADVEAAAVLLARVWSVVPLVPVEQTWLDRLRDCGARLAERHPGSPVVAESFRRSAAVLFDRGEYRAAEVDGMRELAVWRRLDDLDGLDRALRSLGATFRRRGRLHRVIDCADEALAAHLRHGDPRGIARALCDLGSIMLEVGSVDTAVDYPKRAGQAHDGLADATAEELAAHAVLLGRALWSSGSEINARRQFRRARAVLVDAGADAAAIHRVDRLVDLPGGADLPDRDPDHP